MKKSLLIPIILAMLAFNWNCGGGEEKSYTVDQQVEYSPDKDMNIQKYNVAEERKYSPDEHPCDTLALAEYVLDNYPAGSYLVTFDKTDTYSIPRYAVKYLRNDYVLALIATSRPGERLIEVKNIVGYEQSFINLDSTKLGTAFFYLTLFDCSDNRFEMVWEVPVPNHGGFNNMSLDRWNYNHIPYVTVTFHYARGIGHIDYNYFMINGWEKPPHLMMTYLGISFRRTITNYNNDEYPDYYEYAFYDLPDRVAVVDSIPYVWDVKKNVYVNTRNKRHTRLY